MNVNDMDIEELRKALQEAQESYGLKYKTHSEQGDAQLLIRDNFPHLQKIHEYSTVKDEAIHSEGLIEHKNRDHLLIEGDNLTTLTVLQNTHLGKIDVIYIDPPYNTGNDFVYNDKFVSNDDGFRHSKWLSFMRVRLELAKNLLADDGFIFISIDDNEQSHLKVMMDEIFGRENFITNFSWISSSKDFDNYSDDEVLPTLGANLGMFKNTHEYILAYRKTKKAKFALTKSETTTISSRVTKRGNASSIMTLKKGTKARVENHVFTGTVGGAQEPITLLDDMVIENYELTSDVRIEGQFSSPNMVRDYYDGQEVIDGRGQKFLEVFISKTGVPQMMKEKKGEIIPNTLSGFGDTSKSFNLLRSIIGDKFEYPKPYQLLQKLIALHENKNAVILDFFAGSGSTGHAVVELNKEDGGNRQVILATSNFEQDGVENGIARGVTSLRMRRILTGKEWEDGKEHDSLPGNLHYYKTHFKAQEVELFPEDENAKIVAYVEMIEDTYHAIEPENLENIDAPLLKEELLRHTILLRSSQAEINKDTKLTLLCLDIVPETIFNEMRNLSQNHVIYTYNSLQSLHGSLKENTREIVKTQIDNGFLVEQVESD